MAPSDAKADPLNTPADRDFHAGKMPNVTRLQRNEAGELVKVQPACFAQREGMAGKIRFANEPKPTPEAPKAPAAPADAYRQQAEQIIREFGEVRGRDYVDRGMTYGEALQAELAAKTAEHKQLSEAVAKQDRKAGRGKGFAGKLRFGGSFRAISGKHEQRKGT